MSVSPTSGNPLLSSGSGSGNSGGLQTLNYNFNTFLTLFTTQLKNQDPMQPMDTTQMTNQLALFSQVEQQAATNTRLDMLLAAQQTNWLNSAVGYVGHTVEANGNQLALQDGKATVAYNMPAAAKTVRIDITDPTTGKLIKTLSGNAGTGMQHVAWDGTDSTGAQVPNGTYQITVTADTGSTVNTVTPVPRSTGRVTAVEVSNGNVMLDMGTLQVKLSDVLTVGQ